MREIVITFTDEKYNRVIRTCNKRNRSPAGICKHMLLQLADNDEIEEATGKSRSDYAVVKKQRYNNQRRKKWRD